MGTSVSEGQAGEGGEKQEGRKVAVDTRLSLFVSFFLLFFFGFPGEGGGKGEGKPTKEL